MAHTGAMIAAKLRDEDAERLAVENGEPVDELHLTLLFLGEAAAIPEDTRDRILNAVATVAEKMNTVNVEAFAVSVFNPPGVTRADGMDRDTCVTALVSDPSGDLVTLRGAVEEIFLGEALGFEMPEQHSPWQPHVTLAYVETTDVAPYVDRVGPLVVDGIRVAFGGDVYDIPLGDDEISQVESHSEALLSDVDVDDFGEIIVPNVLLDLRGDVDSFQRERDLSAPGPGGHNLRNYWVRGKGAAKIRWGTKGSMRRCIRQLRKYVRDPGGLCAEYHKRATGEWPRGGLIPSGEESIALGVEAADRAASDVNVVTIAAGWEDQPRAPRGTSIGGQWIESQIPSFHPDVSADFIQPYREKSRDSFPTLDSQSVNDMWSVMERTPELTDDQKDAVRSYTSGGYSLNKSLYEGKPLDTADRKKAENLQQSMRESRDPLTLYRATSYSELGVTSHDELAELVGETIKSRGFKSTGTKKAITHSGNLRLEIEAPIGTPMVLASKYSVYPGEHEMILPAGMHYRVVDVEKRGDQSVARLRVVPMSDEPTITSAAAPMPPTHAGLVLLAQDTGRVLMLQRSVKDESDPAAGTWEFPGGTIEDGEEPEDAADREWEEEIGQPVPDALTVDSWVSPSGGYRGFIAVTESEDDLELADGRVVINPDDPDGDDSEQAAWWKIEDAIGNPALRDECKLQLDATPWVKMLQVRDKFASHEVRSTAS